MTKLPQRPFSIRIFVPDGDPDGLRLVEKSNWTGLGVVFNRTIYRQSVVRPEFDKTGVYILVGTTEGSSLPTLYVGEGDPVATGGQRRVRLPRVVGGKRPDTVGKVGLGGGVCR